MWVGTLSKEMCLCVLISSEDKQEKKENELIPIVNILEINILNLGSQHRRLSSFQAS